MRKIERINPFLKRLEELWLEYPDYRFGQLIYMLADEIGGDIFFPEEEAWLKHMTTLIERNHN